MDNDLGIELLLDNETIMIVDAAVDATIQINDGMVNSQPAERKRSRVWDYYLEIKDANGKRCGGKCRACGKEYRTSSRNGTSPLLTHLKKCPKKRNVNGEERSEMTAITSPVVSPKNVIVEHKCLVTENIHDYYKDLLENLENYSSQLHLYGDLRPVILSNYEKEKERLRKDLKTQSFGRFSLSINLSRHGFGTAYCCLTLQFIDDGWKLRKKVLAFKRLEFSTDYLDLSVTISATLSDWSGNVQKKLCCITNTDETYKTVSEIKKWLVQKNLLLLGGKWSHIYCYSHFLNLLIEAGLQEVSDIYEKIRKCISYVSQRRADADESSLPVVDCVWSQIKEMNIEGTAVNLNGDLQILGRMLSLKDGFGQLEINDLEFKQLNLEEEEWNKATLIYQQLEEFDNHIRSFTAGKFLTANVYCPAVCWIYSCLCQWETNDNLCVKSMASKMKPTFDKYWKSSMGVLAIAIILDPRFKLTFVESRFREVFDNDADNHLKTVREIFEKAYNEYSRCHVTVFSGMLGSWGLPYPSNDADHVPEKYELERYLEEPAIRAYEDLDVLGWWRLYEPHFPRLAKMARDFLAIPMSAALSNPSFDDDIKKISAASIDLDPEIIEDIISLKDWSSTA